jgi:hypothetical protein
MIFCLDFEHQGEFEGYKKNNQKHIVQSEHHII